MPNRGTTTGDQNRDPITKTKGAHPVGTGVGAAAGGMAGSAAAGAAAGTVAGGPVGAAAGLVAGAVAGGLAGKKIAERINPTEEDAYWREAYRTQPYYSKEYSYDDYAPAYRTGYEGYSRYSDRSFDDVESELRASYEQSRGRSRLSWERAKDATRAAWQRVSNAVERAIPGDSDRDGR
jgi:hypothetical protein